MRVNFSGYPRFEGFTGVDSDTLELEDALIRADGAVVDKESSALNDILSPFSILAEGTVTSTNKPSALSIANVPGSVYTLVSSVTASSNEDDGIAHVYILSALTGREVFHDVFAFKSGKTTKHTSNWELSRERELLYPSGNYVAYLTVNGTRHAVPPAAQWYFTVVGPRLATLQAKREDSNGVLVPLAGVDMSIVSLGYKRTSVGIFSCQTKAPLGGCIVRDMPLTPSVEILVLTENGFLPPRTFNNVKDLKGLSFTAEFDKFGFFKRITASHKIKG